MTTLELVRLQFGVTTLFHFIFVPMSIGLAFWVAWCQTRWHRSGDETYLRMTRFWGKLLLISFAIGVVTGIVQEFQFGMNWSQYSRYVGDIFGAPLAMEGLAAFFTTSPAFDLTLRAAASTSYTLTVMTVVAALLVPVVLVYQAWTYWVFRARLGRADFEQIRGPVDVVAKLTGGTPGGGDGPPSPSPSPGPVGPARGRPTASPPPAGRPAPGS